MSEVKEINIGKFTFFKDPLGNHINMEWIEDSNYCMFPDEEKDLDLQKEDLIKLCRFIRHNIDFTEKEFQEAFRTY